MNNSMINGLVKAVCLKSDPGLPKFEAESIHLIEGLGVEGDYHSGKFVRHRYLAKKDPTRQNLRQVLIVDSSILEDVANLGIILKPGMLGENILVDGIKIMDLSPGTLLEIGSTLLEVTEIRNPCLQLMEIHPNLLKSVASKVDGKVRRKAGMMARIIKGGWIRRGDLVIPHVNS